MDIVTLYCKIQAKRKGDAKANPGQLQGIDLVKREDNTLWTHRNAWFTVCKDLNYRLSEIYYLVTFV